MTLHPTELRSRLQTAIDAAEIDATELARKIGRSPEYIRDFLNGRKNSMKANELVRIEVELKTDVGFLTGFGVDVPPEATKPMLRGFNGKPTSAEQDRGRASSFLDQLRISYGDRMPIFSAQEEEDSCIIVDSAPIEFVQRPWFLKEIVESFAITIPVYSYDPIFCVNDLALINPRAPLVRNRNALLGYSQGRGLFRAQIAELVKWTKTSWIIRRLGSSQEEELARDTWTSAFRVAGRIES